MVTGTVRNIVKIDEDRCTGCGECIISCAEGALAIIDGKARLVSEKYCDGLGNCLGCPEGAISIEERPADEFDEAAVEAHLKAEGNTGFSCPAETVTEFAGRTKTPSPTVETPASALQSRLGHWPVQLTLVPPTAPFLKDSDVVLAADCVPFACADFHRDFLADHALLVACPKLDDFPAHLEKLTVLLRQSGLKSLTVVHMEVPCCSGLVHLARQAILASGNIVPFNEVTIGVRGDRLAG
ncbi:MAG TPA: 4Fe-4S binding protein [Dehalococcoidales bacterium]|nr:4Fe-4S binding protein [Dehalococcoidales bacterium]